VVTEGFVRRARIGQSNQHHVPTGRSGDEDSPLRIDGQWCSDDLDPRQDDATVPAEAPTPTTVRREPRQHVSRAQQEPIVGIHANVIELRERRRQTDPSVPAEATIRPSGFLRRSSARRHVGERDHEQAHYDAQECGTRNHRSRFPHVVSSGAFDVPASIGTGRTDRARVRSMGARSAIHHERSITTVV
jgi:hypothetical protein